jgi:phospholipase/carboxylesterase
MGDLNIVRAATLYAMNTPESATDSAAAANTLPALETVELCTGPNPSASIIWLHGLGADGHDFEALVPHLAWPEAPDIRFIFPHAPVRPVTLNGGMPMRAWYDILSIDSGRGHDQRGIMESISQITALLEHEQERGIASERIVLAGFSQGGAIAMQLALRHPHKLAGLITLSTYLLFADQLESNLDPANRNMPVFAGHGNQDPVVPFSMGELMVQRLQTMGYPVEWHNYPMQHSVCAEEVEDIVVWLADRFA